ncbi:MAG: LLM class flavin-dependent oxidoreductase [Actinophytocola sp.]|uniref:LLM class flavin-dependent oxidoreductase n=1 Tax=Actinophytocola sp. TaxID=1872138 RepID=UPI00132A5BE6|nr:LLM class flavin-dependent oxidoreductase [Actinophytocola sp.]MPZ83659.1 LLM class flavin-dependent oxidoreductase [Actinophytocola sp.]
MELSFGLKTPPVHTTYDEILRVWQEADTVPAIEHAWLWDHFVPLFGDPAGPILEGWTLLAALAARTERLGLGLMVSANMARPPAVLGKMAATVDAISGGRLVFGIGVGGTALDRPHQDLVLREYHGYGLPLVSPDEGIARLAETCSLVRRMWTGEPFSGEAVCVPARQLPILIGGWGRRTLRVVAEHADIWNVPGPPHNAITYLAERSRILDEHCAAMGRDPREITRSTQVIVSYDDPAATRAVLHELTGIGFSHLVLNLAAPYPQGVARWLAEEIVEPVLLGQGAQVRQ